MTTHSLPVSRRHIATNEDLRRWPHLDDISLPDTGDKKVTILIGGDRPDIIDKQLDKREGEHGEPIAVKTPLGWTVYGPIGDSAEDRVHVNFARTDRERLNAQLERMYNEEFSEANADVEEGMSFEDRKAQEIMDRSVTLSNGHYQLKLPFRQDPPNLPDSLPRPERRLTWLKGKRIQYSIVSTVLLLKSTEPKEHQDRCLMTNLLTSNQSGTFLTTLYGIQGNQKNPG